MVRWAERVAVPATVAATLASLAVVFYYPVGTVLADAVLAAGRPTAGPILDVLTDPFYTGVGHHLFVDPLGVPAGVLDWIGAGLPSLSVDLLLVGVFHLYTDPFGVPGTILGWITTGFPRVSFGLFGFTAYQAALSTIASVLLGLPGAYVLARFEFRGRRTLRSLTIIPFVLPSIMVAVGFVAMFGRTGLLNDVLGVFGLGPVTVLYSLPAIIIAHAFYNAPLVTRLVTTAWESVDRRQVESARAMGASPLHAFRDVVVPTLLPALLTASLLTFIFTFMSFPIVMALGGLELATVEVWIYDRVQALDMTEAATLATIETVLSLVLTYVYLRYEARQRTASGASQSIPRAALVRGRDTLKSPKRIALLAYGLVVAVVFLGPLVSLLVESVTTPDGSFTTAYYEFLLAQQASSAVGTTQPLPAIVNSLVYGAGTLLLAVPMGIVIAILALRGGRGSRIGEALLSAPLAVSGVIVGLGLLQTAVFGTELFGYRITAAGPIAIVFAHAAASYPFVTRSVAPALGGLDSRYRDAARSLGASRLRALLDVELPLVAAAVLAGAAFAFAISIGEFDSTVLLAEGVDSYTMPVALERYIGNRSLGPNLGPATAMGTVLLAVTALSFIAIDRLGGRWER